MNRYHISYIERFAKFLVKYGITQKQLLDGCALSPSDLANPIGLISEDLFLSIFRRGRYLSGAQDLAVHWGLHLKPTHHGFVGLASIACANLRDTLDVICRYIPLCIPKMGVHYKIRGEWTDFIVSTEWIDYPDREFEMIATIVFFQRMAREVLDAEAPHAIEMALRKPSWWNSLPETAYRHWIFESAENKITFPTSHLDQLIVSADAGTALQMRQVCEQSLMDYGKPREICCDLKRILAMAGPRLLNQEAAARQLGMTVSSLSRRLSREGQSFRAISEDVRSSFAARLVIEDPTIPLEEIARILGYHDISNFNRAFRRWHGVSPAAYRK